MYVGVQMTFWAYFLCLAFLAVQIVRGLPTVLRAASSAVENPYGITLQLVVIATLAVVLSQGFLYRPVYFLLAVCLAVGTAGSFWRSPLAPLAAAAGASLICTAAFTLLPVRKQPNAALAILPGVAAACAVTVSWAWMAFRPARTSEVYGMSSSPAAGGLVLHQHGGWWALLGQSALAMVASTCIGAMPGQVRPECADDSGWQQRVCWAITECNAMLATALAPVMQWVQGLEWLRAGGMSPPQLLLWVCFCTAPALTLLTGRGTLLRLLSALFGFLIMFMILTISWEGVFFACFACTLLAYSQLLTQADGEARGVDCGLLKASPAPCGAENAVLAMVAATDDGTAGPGALVSPRTPQPRRAAALAAAQLAKAQGGRAVSRRGQAAVRRRGRSASARRRSNTPARPSVTGGGEKASSTAGARSESVGAPGRGARLDGGLRMVEAWYAFALVFSINLGFFGTGNMASVASFEPASVLRLMTCAPPAKYYSLEHRCSVAVLCVPPNRACRFVALSEQPPVTDSVEVAA